MYIYFILQFGKLFTIFFSRYAICGDQTIIKITKTRPSTQARLANIDGVNQVRDFIRFF